MATLSLAMIVKNEQRHLPRCLDSVRGLVDEMVIVDTGSADDTVAIAESRGAKVAHFAWNDDFSAARNEGLRHCTGDWVLVLDADEALDRTDHGRIRAVLQDGEAPAFALTLRTYFQDSGSVLFDQPVQANDHAYEAGSEFPFYADFQGLRLCRWFPDLRFEGPIHELLDPYFQSRQLGIRALPAVIHHFGKVDPAREREKAAHYLRMAEAQAAAAPDQAQAQFALLHQAVAGRAWDLAVTAGERCLALGGEPSSTTQNLLGLAYLESGRPAQALPHLEQLLERVPGHPLALANLAFCCARLGRFEEAHQALRRGLSAHPVFPNLHAAQAETLLREGRLQEAEAALRAGILACPLAPHLRTCLMDLEATLGREAQVAVDAWAALQAMPGAGEGDWHERVAAFLVKEGSASEAAKVIALGLKFHPGHAGLRALASSLGLA